MSISKPHTHPRQPFHLRRVQLHVIGVARKILKGAGIAHPHIISHEENDIGLISCTNGQRNQTENQKKTDHGQQPARKLNRWQLHADLFKNTAGGSPGNGIGTNFSQASFTHAVKKMMRRNPHGFTSSLHGIKVRKRQRACVGTALPPEYSKRTILKRFRFVMIIIPIRKSTIECG